MINILTKLFFLMIGLTVHLLSSQTIEGTIVDINENPISYANIQIAKTGILSNEEGAFLVELNKFKPTDSVKISYLGFQSLKFTVKHFTSKKYVLEEKVTELSEVLLSKKKMNLEEVLSKIKENLADNYSDNHTKQQIFTRNSYSTTFKKFNFEFTKSTLLNKKQLKKTNEAIHKLINNSLNKPTTSFSEQLSELYVAKDTSKLRVIKYINLINKKDDRSQEALSKLLLKAVVSQLDKKATYKVKSGMFPVEDSLKVEDIKMYRDSLSMRPTKKYLVKTINKYTFKKKSDLDFVTATKKYNYVLAGMDEYDDEMVYVITFKPKKSSAKFTGTMYVNAYDFAIVKVDFSYGKGKSGEGVNLKLLLGVKYREHTWNASVVYKKNVLDKYQLKFISQKRGSYVYMSRSFKLKKNRANRSESKKIIKLDVLVEQNDINKKELFFISSEELSKDNFNAIQQREKYKIHYVPKYSNGIWKGYNVLSPIQDIKNYKTK